jgi:hypothetical protein
MPRARVGEQSEVTLSDMRTMLRGGRGRDGEIVA